MTLYEAPRPATIMSLEGGFHLLSFREFTVCCGPERYVYLSSNPFPPGLTDLGDVVELSPLMGTEGDQDYIIPADVDLS